jgi:hypothetical protein
MCGCSSNSLYEVAIDLQKFDGVLYVCKLHGVLYKLATPTNKSANNKGPRHQIMEA